MKEGHSVLADLYGRGDEACGSDTSCDFEISFEPTGPFRRWCFAMMYGGDAEWARCFWIAGARFLFR